MSSLNEIKSAIFGYKMADNVFVLLNTLYVLMIDKVVIGVGNTNWREGLVLLIS
jgi:hypothetical protein